MIEKVINEGRNNAIQAVDQICHRCLGNHLEVGENHFVYCEDCAKQQVISDHVYLYRYQRKRQVKNHKLKLSFHLSEPQLKGQLFIEKCYHKNKDGFLHAVCGAGKTEMTLSTILLALNEGKSIAFVIPRVEIIQQIIRRFNSYFPKTLICGLFQDHPLIEDADIMIATPQQMIKFYHEFDLMILDEVDAFPFYQNDYLNRLVEKASKPSSVKIYISATMPTTYQKLINNQGYEYCLIPERYHQKPLVIPTFKRYQYLYANHILKYIMKYQDGKRKLLVYFPSIHLMSRFHYFLKSNGVLAKTISSKTSFKSSVIKHFVHGDYFVLLSTTILERGVTFSACDAIVLEADHPIFNQETLIQIAGRVGRDQMFSEGSIIFFSRYLTTAMQKARKSLIKMNEAAKREM